MDDNKIVISIGRRYGSGGREIGRKLAELFNIDFYDKELITLAAKQSGFSEEILKENDENHNGSFLYSLVMGTYTGGNNLPLNHKLFLAQFDTIKMLAEEKSCVIIGRCSSHMFRNYEKHVSIFLHADMNSRMERLKRTLKKDNLGEKNVNDLEKSDRRRAQYYNTFTGKKWLDLRNYDFALDTTPFSDKQIEDILVNYITARFPELKQRAGL